MTKVTFTLDDGTVGYLNRTAERLGIPKSQVVREAIHHYGEHLGRLSDEERARLLGVFDEVTSAIPDRSRAEVDAELSELRRARLHAGRGRSGEGRSP